MQKTIIKSLLLIIAFTFALSANYIFAVWTGPTQVPPGGNTPTPIHVGAVDQVKSAGLALNSLAVFGNGFFQGNVGIKTSNISTGGEQNLSLDVEGAIGAKFYCDENGNNCLSVPFGGGGIGDGWVMMGDPYRKELTEGVSDNRIYFNSQRKNAILSIPITMPSSGGPFKVLASWGVDGDMGGGKFPKIWVQDSLSTPTKLAAGISYQGGGPIQGGLSEISPSSYSNSQQVTFTLYIKDLDHLREYFIDNPYNSSLPDSENIRGNWLSIQVFGKESSGGGGGSSGSLSFGNWETKVINTIYKATSDGFVVTANTPPSGVHYGYTDGNSNPTTLRTVSDSQGDGEGIMMPVKSGDYWRVYQPTPIGTSNNVYWLPVVSGGGGGSSWVDITADTGNFDTQCEYKWIRTDGTQAFFATFVYSYVVGMDYSAGNYQAVNKANKGITSGDTGTFNVSTYKRCGGVGGGGGGSLNSTTFTNPTKTLSGTNYPLCLTVAGDTTSLQMTTINQFCSEKGYEFGEVFDLQTEAGNYAYYYNSSWTNGSCGAKALSVRCFK